MKFTYNPRILKQLGTELITSDEVAITELVKNSYDAKSSKVLISFVDNYQSIDVKNLLNPIPQVVEDQIKKICTDNLIIIEDDGKGMSYDVLKRGFFEVGSTIKKEQKLNQTVEDEDVILGDKGIGRLSAQRLSPILLVETFSNEKDNKDTKNINVVQIEWSKFIDDSSFNAPEWLLDTEHDSSYTRLWFIGTNDNPIIFDNKYFEKDEVMQIDIFGNHTNIPTGLKVTDELQSALSFFYSPFEKSKSILDLKIKYNSESVIVKFHYDTLKIAESVHSFKSEVIYDKEGKAIDLLIVMKMELRPWFLERIHQSLVGKILFDDWQQGHIGYKKIFNKYKDRFEKSLTESIFLSELLLKEKLPISHLKYILKISPLEGEIHSFKRDNSLLRMAMDSALENGYIDKNAKINTQIRTFLAANNGIKLYRDKFRIGSIGNTDNDWLQLQQKRTSGQQFYRFELGNVIGFVKIHDLKQEYIYETSSREHLTGNLYVYSLQGVLDYILEVFSPRFSKRAVEITKDILVDEKLIPQNDLNEIKAEVNKSDETLRLARENIKAIQKAFDVISQNIDLDTDIKRNTVKKLFEGLADVTSNFEQNISNTEKSFQNAQRLIQIAESQQKRIEVEAYNNYKLMANGLVTEVITHELHSLLSGYDTSEVTEEHINILKEYLFSNEKFDLNKNHLQPIKKNFDYFSNKMGDLERFYTFIEKTFLYKGNSEDLEKIDVKEYMNDLQERFDFRLKKNKIQFDYSTISQEWTVPKGSLLHIFYNLIDNSIYWIQERQRRARYDVSFKSEDDDRIVIAGINENTIHLFDSGTGVLEKYQHTLFNSLESGKNEGRGMGLYIVRNFLRSFGGDIQLLPQKNKFGNRYIFEITIKK